MNDRPAEKLLTIGQLSELTGIPVRTIRFYSDTQIDGFALVQPRTRSTAGYRLYDLEAVSRLEMIKTLRDLGIDLPTVARVLARKITVAEVARAHAEALEATIKVIRLRQAVLHAVAVTDGDWKEMELMHRLAKLDATERKRIVDGYLDQVFGGIEVDGGRDQFAQMMRNLFPELPEDPSPQQVEAWVELVALIQDDEFIAVSRRMAVHGAEKRARLSEEDWLRDQAAFATVLAPEAATAFRQGIIPDSPDGRTQIAAIVTKWADSAGKPDTPETRAYLLDNLETMTDHRVNHFWALVAIVGNRPELPAQNAPMFESMEWLISALKVSP